MYEMSQERLKDLLAYDPETGEFRWIKPQSNRAKAGDVAGYVSSKGYRRIGIDGKEWQAHRLAWLFVHGKLPAERTDHINGNRGDNRICNLREATAAENQKNSRMYRNNTSGYKGVRFFKPAKLWHASAMLSGKVTSLGYFKVKEEAAAAYRKFAEQNHGAFFNPEYLCKA